jgi:hypothetical protein
MAEGLTGKTPAIGEQLKELGAGRADDFVSDNNVADILAVAERLHPL